MRKLPPSNISRLGKNRWAYFWLIWVIYEIYRFVFKYINFDLIQTEVSFMWGICLDSKALVEGLFQTVVQYKIDNSKAIVILPKATLSEQRATYPFVH